MARDRELKVKIVGDASSAQNAFRDTQQGLSRFGPAGQKANAMLGKVQGRLDGFGPLGQKASRGLGAIEGGLGSIGPVASTAAVGVAAAGAAFAKFAADGVSKFAAYAQEVRNFQRASGATVEQSSRFVAVLDDLAISSETGAAAISKLTRNADAGKLAPFNIEVAKTKDGLTDTTGTLLNVADAYAAMTDPAEKARLRFAAFGKQGDALIPMLEKGRAGLKAFFEGVSDSQILDQDDLDKAEAYRLAMDRLGDSISDIQRDLGGGAIGGVASFTNGLAQLIEKGQDVQKSAPGWFGELTGLAQKAAGGSMGFLVSKVMELGRESSEAAKGQNEQKEAMLANARAAEENANALDDLVNATLGSFNAAIGYERSLNSLQDAQADVVEKERELLEANREHGTASKETVAANEELSRAYLNQRDAALQVAAAAAKHAEEQAKANGHSWDAARDGIPAQIGALAKLRDSLAPGNPLRANLDQYIAQLESLQGEYNTNVNIRINTVGSSQALAAYAATLRPEQRIGMVPVADGAVFYANGGEHHVAQIAPAGAMRVWAEPETGGEAYIPLAPAKRGRSLAIWQETGRKLGVQSFANGGTVGGSAAASIVINIGYYAGSAAMLRADLARELERNGNFSLSYK